MIYSTIYVYFSMAVLFRLVPDQFKPDVVLANWAIVHQLWHTSLEDFEGFLEHLGKQLDSMVEKDGHRPRFVLYGMAWHMVHLMCDFIHMIRSGRRSSCKTKTKTKRNNTSTQ